MSKDNLSINNLNDRTVYVCAVNVEDLPEAVAKGISQDQVYSLNSSNGERLDLLRIGPLHLYLLGKMSFILCQFINQPKFLE